MARRGAPDKTHGSSAETVEVECPSCSAVLRLEMGILALDPEVLCAGCDTTIALAMRS
jgi:ribosomal protein S27E